jgi:predicted RNA-binding Zn ribbon-like protein
MPSSGKSATRHAEPETAHLWGGRLCLDFANSVDWSLEGEPLGGATEVLVTPRDLVRWGARMGLLGRAVAGAAELERAHALRLAVYRAFAAIARDEAPARADLELLRAEHAEAVAAGTPEARDGGWAYAWPRGEAASVRHAVAADAAALLADPARVRCCPGRNCHWLFLDTSGRRRWCSMSACGSREKMRRHYHRQRQASLPGGGSAKT